jgi:hypothetical protein
MEKNARTLAAILAALGEAGAGHALFGGLAAWHYGRERTTTDVDLLVPGRCIDQIQAAIEHRGYRVRQFSNLAKIYVAGEPESICDLLPMETNATLRAAFAAAGPAIVLGFPVRIVPRGIFVALKFEAAATPRRRPKDRMRDVLDIQSVLNREFGPLDEREAIVMAGKMYPGAVADFLALLDDIRHGRPPLVALRAVRRSAFLLRHGIARSRRRIG